VKRSFSQRLQEEQTEGGKKRKKESELERKDPERDQNRGREKDLEQIGHTGVRPKLG
jgi:hypothetical protein